MCAAHEKRLSASCAFLLLRSRASKPHCSHSLAHPAALALARHTGIPITLRRDYGLAKDVSRHLTSNYGTRALQVAEVAKAGAPALGARLSPRFPFIYAEVAFAVQHEYAVHAEDVLARRTRLAFLNAAEAAAAAPGVIALMGDLLGWDGARRREEAAAVARFLETMSATPQQPAAG